MAPDEVVVWDAASTETTWQVLQLSAARSTVPFPPIRQQHNVGLRRKVQKALASLSAT